MTWLAQTWGAERRGAGAEPEVLFDKKLSACCLVNSQEKHLHVSDMYSYHEPSTVLSRLSCVRVGSSDTVRRVQG